MTESDKAQTARQPYLSVVIPVYNERATILAVLTLVQRLELEKEIIIVDDGSSDGTRDLIVSLVHGCHGSDGIPFSTENIRIFLHDRNQGKGAAVRKGFQECRGEVVLVQDADLELSPRDYPALLDPIKRGVASAVYGSRFLDRPTDRGYALNFLANKFLTGTFNVVAGTHLSDVWTGYKVFTRHALRALELTENRFNFELEVTARVVQAGFPIFEVPVSYSARTHAEGKKMKWRDGLRALIWMLRYAFKRLKGRLVHQSR